MSHWPIVMIHTTPIVNFDERTPFPKACGKFTTIYVDLISDLTNQGVLISDRNLPCLMPSQGELEDQRVHIAGYHKKRLERPFD